MAVVAVAGGVGAIRSSNRLVLPPFAPKRVSTLNPWRKRNDLSVERDIVGADTRADICIYNANRRLPVEDCAVRATFRLPEKEKEKEKPDTSQFLTDKERVALQVFSKRKNWASRFEGECER